MGEKEPFDAEKPTPNRLKAVVDVAKSYGGFAQKLILAVPLSIAIGYGVFALVVKHDAGPLKAWLESKIPSGANPESAGQTPGTQQPPTRLAGSIYIDGSSSDPLLTTDLIRYFHDDRVQVTDDPAQAATVVNATSDVALRPGSTVGNTATWLATAASSLKAMDRQSRATLLWTTFEGHGAATRPDLARQYALDDAAVHLAAEYKKALNANKHAAKQEATP